MSINIDTYPENLHDNFCFYEKIPIFAQIMTSVLASSRLDLKLIDKYNHAL